MIASSYRKYSASASWQNLAIFPVDGAVPPIMISVAAGDYLGAAESPVDRYKTDVE
jgi:hypothetical protein